MCKIELAYKLSILEKLKLSHYPHELSLTDPIENFLAIEGEMLEGEAACAQVGLQEIYEGLLRIKKTLNEGKNNE